MSDIWTDCVKRKWKVGPFQQSHIYHADGSLFMARWAIGALWLHAFMRADKDPYPHDHEWDFWTLPTRSYLEEVLVGSHLELRPVTAWRIHHRKAEHAHRIIASVDGGWPVITFVWKGRARRRWGYWHKLGEENWRWRDAALPQVTLESS